MGRGSRTDNLSPARLRGGDRVDDLLPVEHAAYLRSVDDKHFDPAGAGSVFIDCSSLRELLGRAAAQPGGLDRDDRARLLADGVPASALLEHCRYLRVPAAGRMGLLDAAALPADTPVQVIRTKPGAPCSLVVRADRGDTVDYATVIIGPNEPQPGDPPASTREMVWTAHPGPPIRPATFDLWPEGTTVTAGEVLVRLGAEGRVYLQAQPES